MNKKFFTKTIVFLVSTLALSATPEIDRKIETAVKDSYNFHVILGDSVLATSVGGIVTLTGAVRYEDDSEIAQTTVNNFSDVKGVINNIVVTSDIMEHSDEWMVMKVRTLLLTKSNTESEKIKVSANNGIIMLTGSADSLAQKELTGNYVKELDWVKSVRNLIVIADRHHSDGRTIEEKIDDASINAQLKYTLLHQKATCTLEPAIVTHKGIITITGNVGSETQKALISKLANEVRGVESVKNNMRIFPE